MTKNHRRANYRLFVFDDAEVQKIKTAAEAEDRPVAQWARYVLLREADKIAKQEGKSA
jgi:hypothetical protein